MNIVNTIISGLVRSIKSILGVLTIWISTLLLVSMVAMPLRSSIKSVLGQSMITEKLKDGINVDVVVDFGSNLKTIVSSFTAGFFLMILCGFLLNVFFNGGLFTTLRNDEEKYSTAQFFRGAGINFWPFFIITVLLSLIIVFVSSLVFGIAFAATGAGSTGNIRTAVIIASVVAVLILPVILLVADYARIWQVKASSSGAFKAIGIGFRQTFRNFFSSYPVMFILVFIQVIYSGFMLKFVIGKGPQTGFGILFLFLLTQFLFIIKLILRVWRYGSVTAMYEKHPE